MKLFTVVHQRQSDGYPAFTPAEMDEWLATVDGQTVSGGMTALRTVFASFVSPALEYNKLVLLTNVIIEKM
jgi:hypothetical protein